MKAQELGGQVWIGMTTTRRWDGALAWRRANPEDEIGSGTVLYIGERPPGYVAREEARRIMHEFAVPQ